MRARRRLIAEDESLQHVWPSFADVTSTMALIMFVLVLLSYVRNLIANQELTAYQAEIARSEEKLRVLSLDLARTGQEIATGRARLALSEGELAVQRTLLAENARELETLRSRLSSIALLRVGVLDKVKTAIEAVLSAPSGGAPSGGAPTGAAPLVRIGDNGNIVINEGLVFEYNSFAIKPEGKQLIATLSRALEGVLGDANVRDYVDAIVVQGHTDDRGSSSFNRELSAKRANAVLDDMFATNPALEQAYGSFFAASSFSEFRPLDTGGTEPAFERNRRIEISVVLKDATIPKLIEQYMEAAREGAAPDEPPGAGAPPAPGSQPAAPGAAP
jgi:chemotaxis protein MotB